MTIRSGPDFDVTPELRDEVQRRADIIRRRRRRRGRGAAVLGVALIVVGFSVAVMTDQQTRRDTVLTVEPPVSTGRDRAEPVPELAEHLVPAEAIARISPELEPTASNVVGEDYIVGVADDAVPADAGVARLWSRGYRIPPDGPVPDLIIQISTEIVRYPDEASATATLDRLAEAHAEGATTVELGGGFIGFVPDIPSSAGERPSSSEWFGAARRGDHLIVLRLRAIGTADWSTAFVILAGAADTAAAGLAPDEPSEPIEEQPVPVCDTPAPTRPPMGEESMEVVVYLLCDAAIASQSQPGSDETFVPAGRVVPRSSNVLRAALEALVKGTEPFEVQLGLSSFFSDDAADILDGVTIEDGTAIVDFNRTVNNASTSTGSLLFRGQLNRTVLRFPAVERIEYRLEGSCDAFWQWQQVGDCQLVTRDDL